MKTQITLLSLIVLLFSSVSLAALTYVGDNIYHMNSFQDISGSTGGQTIQMADGDNLLIDFGDGPLSIAQAGYLTGKWHLGLVDDEGYIIGWAWNGARDDDGWEGWFAGAYSYELGEGNRPSGAYLVYDALDNGFHIEADTGLIGLAQDVLEGDLFFTEQDILFNGILGDIAQFSPYGPNSTIPSMTLLINPDNPVLVSPLNAASGVLLETELVWEGVGICTYNVYFGTDADSLDLLAGGLEQESHLVSNLDWSTTYYWQVESVYPEQTLFSVIRSFTTVAWRCQEQLIMDFNNDCRVDLLDLAMFSQYWLAETDKVADN